MRRRPPGTSDCGRSGGSTPPHLPTAISSWKRQVRREEIPRRSGVGEASGSKVLLEERGAMAGRQEDGRRDQRPRTNRKDVAGGRRLDDERASVGEDIACVYEAINDR